LQLDDKLPSADAAVGYLLPEDHDTQLFVDHYKENFPEEGFGLFVSFAFASIWLVLE